MAIIRAKKIGDFLYGTIDADSIFGSTGDDSINAGEGNDSINAGDGADRINAGGGNDRINAGSGDDLVNAGDGDDFINGGAGKDTINAGAGNDTVNSGADDDIVYGLGGNDILTGGSGNDKLDGGSGDDTLTGGADDDEIRGGSGFDVAKFSGSISNYSIVSAGSYLIVTDNRPGSPDGTDKVYADVESLQFANGSLAVGPLLLANSPPVAVNDSGAIGAGGTLSGPTLLANDTDPEVTATLQTLSIFSVQGFQANVGNAVTLPSGAIVTVNANGTFTYNTNGAFSGLANGATAIDTFTYVATDGTDTSNSATVSITVTGTNDAPVVTGVADATQDEGSGNFVVDLLQNASDPDTGASLSVTSLTGDIPPGASISGSSITIDTNNAAYNALAVGQSATYVITYIISDQFGATVPQSATITITGTNDGPTVSPAVGAVIEDGSISGQVTGSDVDAGETATLSFALTVPAPTGLTFNPDGSYTFDASSYDSLPAGTTQTLTIAFTATDVQGSVSAPANLVITITGTNDVPVVSGAVTAAADEDDASFAVDLLAGASDVDTGAVLSVANVSALPAGITLSGNSLTVDPTNPAFESLAAGTPLVIVVSYNVIDGLGGITPQTATITITGTNDAPTVSAAVTAAANEGDGSFAVDLLAGASDVDTGAVLSVDNVSALPAGVTLSGNALTVDPTNAAFNSLDAGTPLVINISYNVIDGLGGITPQTATITITGTNDAPTVSAVVTAAADEGDASFAVDLLAGASDVDTGAVLSVANVSALPAGVTLAGNALTVDPTNAAFNSLAVGQTATINVSYNVVDGLGGSVPQTATITITGTNDLPTVNAAVNSVAEDTSISGQVTGSDVDAGETATLSFALTAPAPTGLTFNPDGSYTFDASSYDSLSAGGAPQVLVIGFTATDAQSGVSAPGTLTITINGTNDAPVITSTGPFGGTITENAPATYTVGSAITFQDIDAADTVTLQAPALLTPDFDPGTFVANIVGTDVVWSYVVTDAAINGLPAGFVGNVVYVLLLDDGNGAIVPTPVTIVIEGTNDAPSVTLGLPAAVSFSEDSGIEVTDLLAGASDPDAFSNLSIANATGLPPGAVIIDGLLIIDTTLPDYQALAAGGPAAVYTVTFDVVDGLGGVTPNSIQVTINGVNNAPVASGPIAVSPFGEDDALPTVDLTSNITDVDGGTLSVVGGTFTQILGPTIAASASGNLLDIDPSDPAIQALANGETLQLVYAYDVIDGQGGTVSQSVVVTITGTNDVPTLAVTPTPLQATSGGSAIAVAAAATIADAEGKVTSISLSLSVDDNSIAGDTALDAGESLGFDAGFAGFLTSLGFTVTGNGNTAPLVISYTAGTQNVTPALLETILEQVKYTNSDTSFGFNANDRDVSITVTDHQGGISNPITVTIDLQANVTDGNGNGTFQGGNLNDDIDGGLGTDTVIFQGDLSEYTVTTATDIGTGFVTGFSVVADSVAGRDGTDTLTSIEKVQFADVTLTIDGAVQVFDGDPTGGGVLVGTFNTIADALAAADAGYTVLVNGTGGPGSSIYSGNENVTITEGVTLRGLGTVTVASVTVSGGGSGQNVDIDNIDVTGTATSLISLANTSVYNSVTFQNGNVTGGNHSGFSTGNPATGMPGVAAIIIADAIFNGNATGGGGGAGAIVIFGYNGDVTIEDVTVSGPVAAQNGIQIKGANTPAPAGDITFTNVLVNGNYSSTGVAIRDFSDVGTQLDFTGVTINVGGTAYAGLQLENVGGNVDLSDGAQGLSVTNLNGAGQDISVVGNGDAQTIKGDVSDDVLVGGGGNDTLDGGNGSDIYIDVAGDGADTISDTGASGIDVVGIFGADTTVSTSPINDGIANDSVNVVVSGGVITSIDGGTVSGIEAFGINLGGGNDTLDYTGTTEAVSVNLSTPAQSATGFNAGAANIENVTGGSNNDSLTGSAGANTLVGGDGNDTLTGLGGADTIEGGLGNDVATYLENASAATITWDGITATVTIAGVTDTITGVGELRFGDVSYWLVSEDAGSDFTTIQSAVNVAGEGDTVLVAAATYTEDVSVAGLGIKIVGSEAGVTVEGQFTVSGTLNGAFAIENLDIDATGNGYGVFVSANSTGFAGSVTLDGVAISGAQDNGFAYIRAGNGSSPTNADTIGNIEILNSSFSNNSTLNTGSNGRGDIIIFGYNQNLTIDNVSISSPAADAQKAIQIRGIQDGADVAGVGPYDPAGDIALTNLTITGSYLQDLIAIYRIAEFDSFTATGWNFAGASAPWGLFNADSVGGVIDLSGTGLTSLSNGAISGLEGSLQGLASNDTLTGSDGNDTLFGRGGNDTINGGAGDDLIRWRTNDGDDANVLGGADADTLQATNTLGATKVTFTIGTNGDTIGSGTDDILLSAEETVDSDALGSVLFDEIEDIIVTLGTGGDTVVVLTPLGGTALSTNTITVNGGIGGDIVDASLLTDNGEINAAVGIDFSGGAGDDTFISGIGNDTFNGGANVDTVSYAAATSGVTVNLSLGGVNATGGGGNDTLTFVENVIGSQYADTITGDSADNVITTGGGSDTIAGGAGIDKVVVTGGIANFVVTTGPSGTVILTGTGAYVGTVVTVAGDVENLEFSLNPGTVFDLDNPVLLLNSGGNIVSTYATIQGAVDASANGQIVQISAGTYEEQVVVDSKNISIVGAGDATIIKLPAAIAAQTLAGGNRASVITVTNATANISDVKVDFDGRGTEALATGAIDFHGITYINAGGIIDDVTVTEVRAPVDGFGYVSGGQQGRGIYANNLDNTPRTLTVTDSTVTDFQKNGIDLRGTGLIVDVSGNTVTGNGATPTTAQNGIVVVGGVSGTIDDNTVSDVGYVHTPSNNEATSAGILNFNSNVAITNNTITAPTDIIVGPDQLSASGAYSTGDTTGSTITGNTITGFAEAISTQNDGAAPVVSGNVLADNDVNVHLITPTAPVTFTGTDGNDILEGSTGADTLTGGGGADTIDGGAGNDTAVYSDDVAAPVWNGSAWVVTSAADGTDTLTDIEIVDDANGGRYLLVDTSATGGFATIQEAVNAAQSGDTILVAPGTYFEQVDINGKTNLTIEGSGSPVIIKAPADLVETARSSSDREINSVVTVENSTNVTLKNITVDGDGSGNTIDEGSGAGQAQFTGVFYRNASGTLEDVNVTGVHDAYPGGVTVDGYPIQSGNQRGVGIQVDNDTLLDFTMAGGSISDFQKNATVFSKANLNVTGVTITGGGAQTINAQNGIQVLDSTGTIAGNIITAIGYAGAADAYSAAVLAYGNADLDITGNTITGTNVATTDAKVVGIYVFSSGTPNSGGSVTGNTISHVDTGIGVYGDVVTAGIAISGNTVTDVDWTDPYAAGVDLEPNAGLAVAFNVTGSEVADILFGSDQADTLVGLGGNDNLDGGLGADTMTGGAGDDTYAVDNAGDIVNEDVGGGNDTVVASVSYALSAGSEVETLRLDSVASSTETFENFTLGAITDGENGWKFAGGPKDQEVIDDPFNPGNKVFRMSSDPSVADFSGPYSPALAATAGEAGTSASADSQSVTFDFRAVQANDLSRLEVDFGNAAGTDRNNFLVIENRVDGISIGVSDPLPNGTFVGRTLVSGIDATAAHSLSFVVTYVAGANNDTIDVYLDGQHIGTSTTFENYRDALGGTHEDNVEANLTNSVFFRGGAGVSDGPGGQNQGFLFDNITNTIFDSGRSLTGNEFGQSIIGDDGDNVLSGLGGDDILIGGLGHDTLIGGSGTDSIDGGAGNDTAVYSDDVAAPVWNGSAWVVTSAADGTDTLTDIEIVDDANGGRYLLVDNSATGGYATIQDAIAAAVSGDTILLAPGTYSGDFTVAAGISIIGAAAGTPGTGQASGAGSILTGQVTVTASAGQTVTFQGIEFQNNSVNADVHNAITVSGGANVVVTNNLFWSTGPNGNSSLGDFGVFLVAAASGNIDVTDNYFSGTSQAGFSTASWRSGVWSDGNSATLDVTGNTFEYVRTGLNLDGYDDATTSISGNIFKDAGSGISIGSGDSTITNIELNSFINVDTDFNLQNLTSNISFDVAASGNVASGAGDAIMQVLTGTGTDAVVGTAGQDYLVGRATDAAADTYTGGGGDDTIQGRGGNDTAIYTGTSLTSANFTAGTFDSDPRAAVVNAAGWQVSTGGSEGTDLLFDIEIVDGTEAGRFLLVGNGGFDTIQAAINASSSGDTILIAPGIYSGNINVNVAGITIMGAGPGVIIQGTFETDNGIAGNVSDFIKTATSYSNAAGTGIAIQASNVTVSNITIDGFYEAVSVQGGPGGISNIAINGIAINDSLFGIVKPQNNAVTNLDVTGGSITDGYIGIYLYNGTAGQVAGSYATDVTINGTSFTNILQKGIYTETLQGTTLFDNLTMTNVGQYGGGPAFGANGANGAGIDVNLKFDTFVGTVTIEDFDFDNVGSSNGQGPNHANAGAITIKARNDAPSYNTAPADVVGLTVLVQNGTIDGTSTGVRAGEAGKNVAGPAITVTNVGINGEAVADYDNRTQSTLTINTTTALDDDSVTLAPTTIGNVIVNGGEDYNVITGGAGNDQLNGGGGNDTFIWASGGGNDIVNGGDGTNDTLSMTLTSGFDEVWISATTVSDLTHTVTFSAIERIEVKTGADNDTIIVSALDGPILAIDGGTSDAVVFDTSGPAGTLNLNSLASGGDFLTFDVATVGVSVNLGTNQFHAVGSTTIHTEAGIEHVTGSGGADVIEGDSGSNIIDAGDGADLLNGGGGVDAIFAGAGDDDVVGGLGNDHIFGGAGKDTLEGGAGADFFYFMASDGFQANTNQLGHFDTLEGFSTPDGDKIVIDGGGLGVFSNLTTFDYTSASVNGGTFAYFGANAGNATLVRDGFNLWYDNNGDGTADFKLAEFAPDANFSGFGAGTFIII